MRRLTLARAGSVLQVVIMGAMVLLVAAHRGEIVHATGQLRQRGPVVALVIPVLFSVVRLAAGRRLYPAEGPPLATVILMGAGIVASFASLPLLLTGVEADTGVQPAACRGLET